MGQIGRVRAGPRLGFTPLIRNQLGTHLTTKATKYCRVVCKAAGRNAWKLGPKFALLCGMRREHLLSSQGSECVLSRPDLRIPGREGGQRSTGGMGSISRYKNFSFVIRGNGFRNTLSSSLGSAENFKCSNVLPFHSPFKPKSFVKSRKNLAVKNRYYSCKGGVSSKDSSWKRIYEWDIFEF